MRIGFIEDTKLRGGTQIWVTEATKIFINRGEEVNIIAPEGSYVANKCKSYGANIYTYDWNDIPSNKEKYEENSLTSIMRLTIPCPILLPTL